MPKILQMRDVCYRYNGREVLAVPALDIARGSIIGLAGPNGSGKTTLLKLLAGIEKPTSGSLEYTGFEGNSRSTLIRHGASLLPQETYLLKRTVFENVAYGLKIRGGLHGLAEDVAEALELVGLDQSFARRKWHELSGGEAQRVALAARLALKPDCLLLDEPTASVDMESARSIRRAVLLARKEWGTTLVIASHHRSWLNDICDRIVYLYNGRILDCSYENILIGPWEQEDNLLVACKLSDGQKVFAVKPHDGYCNAVISASSMEVAEGAIETEKERILQGIIASITLENNHSGLQIHVTCGDHRFVVSTTDTSLEQKNYRPGQVITLHYKPEAITWLKKVE